MPQHTNNNSSSVVLFKEPVVHQIPVGQRSRQRRVSSNPLLLGMLLLAWAALALPAVPAQAAADTCPNAALRALNNSSGLPDCRAYEMVTSPYKEGFVAQEQTYGDDGAFAYFSIGNFADNPFASAIGNQYVARRSESGWKTISMNPPGDQWMIRTAEGAQSGLSKDLRLSLWPMRRFSPPDDVRWPDHPERDAIYVRQPDGVFSLLAPNPGTRLPRVFARTPDLSHVVVGGSEGSLTANQYEVINGDQVLRPVGVDNTGAPLPDAGALCTQGISDDGRVIFFALCNERLFARVGGTRTIEISASQCTRDAGDPGGVCNGDAPVSLAGFAGDGSRALFTTTQQLVNGDTDTTIDLYACDIPAGTVAATLPVNSCPNLREVSGTADDADVEGVVRIADDGSRVYFVAHGVLADNHGANDQVAVAGAHNLYVWQADAGHPAGNTTFVARPTVNDVGSVGNGETTPDGRYLLVNTTTALVTSGPGADTDSAADVYRYDAVTGEWLRLSTDTRGSGGNAELDALSRGSAGKGYVRQRVSMTDDAHTIVFSTSEALSPADTNSIDDVYAWHEGQVSLISADGGGGARITASGTDIFFSTDSHLTAADGDTNSDVYDARINGGFDLREPAPCEGEGCLKAPSAPPGLPSGTSVGGTGDVQEPAPRFTLRAITIAQRRALARTGRVTITVTASKPGTVAARAEATVKSGGKASSVATARDVLASAGSVRLTLRLSQKARARLAAKRRLAVKLVISHSKFALARSVTLNLTLGAKVKKAAKQSSGGRGSDSQGGRS